MFSSAFLGPVSGIPRLWNGNDVLVVLVNVCCGACLSSQTAIFGGAGVYSLCQLFGFIRETEQLAHVKPRRASSFHRRFLTGCEYKFLTTSAFVIRLWRLSSVRVGTPRPSSPVTRWVAFHWVLWTLQLDKHSTAHSACLAAVWTARPRQDPLLHFICHPTATPANLSLLGRKIKNLAWKHDPWFVRTLSGWI